MAEPGDRAPRGREPGASVTPGLDPFDDASPAARRARQRQERRAATGEGPVVGPSPGAGGRRAAGAGGRGAGGAPGPGGGGALLADRRLRLLVPALVLLVLLLVVVRSCGGESPEDVAAERARQEAARPQLPGGGRALFPDHRLVAFTGAPQDEALGVLGIGSATTALGKLERQARPYARRTRPTMPGLHLISTIAQADPGQGGRYSQRQSSATIGRFLAAARRAEGLLILDVQPGRADFLTETRRLERWLREPDVALALDPEWRMQDEGDVPGQVIGSVGREELQATLDEVARVVRENDLPPKLVVVHRFTEDMIRGLEDVRIPEGVVPVMSIDGVGGREIKTQKYRQLSADLPQGWRTAFKLFYEEDAEAGGLMTPAQVMALAPRPDMVIYE